MKILKLWILLQRQSRRNLFSAAIWDEKERIVDLEIADSENANEIKKEINKRLQIQGIMSYKVNISQKKQGDCKCRT